MHDPNRITTTRSSPTAARSSTSTSRVRPSATPSTRAPSRSACMPERSGGTPSSATGSPSPPTGRTAPSCRRRTSARSARPGWARCPRRSRSATTRSSSSRTASRPTRSGAEGADAPTREASSALGPASGRCEVVCFTSDHEASFKDLPVERVRTVIDTWAHRTRRAVGALPEVEQVFCFENRGKEIGVTLPHPHGQIYAYPYLPTAHRAAARRRARHHERTGRLLGADILAAERADGSRVVIAGTALDGIRPVRRALAGRGAPRPAPRRAGPRGARRRGARRAGRRLPRPAAAARPLLRRRGGSPVPLPYIAAWQQAPAQDGPRRLAPAPAARCRCCADPAS